MNQARVVTLAHPWWGASMIEYTRAESPAIESSAPTGSSRACSGSLERGTRNHPATSAPMMIGTLTKNTAPHEKCSSRKPLAIGPRAAPAPEMPAQMAMAFVRSCGGKTLASTDNVDGITKAAPRPITARPRMTPSAVSRKAATRQPARKMRSPICRAPLRPYRSPRAPAVNRNPANTRA